MYALNFGCIQIRKNYFFNHPNSKAYTFKKKRKCELKNFKLMGFNNFKHHNIDRIKRSKIQIKISNTRSLQVKENLNKLGKCQGFSNPILIKGAV